MNTKTPLALAVSVALLAGCVTVPSGPSVTAYPGTGKTYEQFRADDAVCRNEAAANNRDPNDAQANDVAKGAVIGTVVGALAGAAIGGNGRAAGVGAGTGLLFGTAAGASAGNQAAYGTQRRYDQWYLQCMYGHGDKVPLNGRIVQAQPAAPAYPPPPPPPPPGYNGPPPGYSGPPPGYVPPPGYH